MSASSSNKPTKSDAPETAPDTQKKRRDFKWGLIVGLPAWVLVGFILAQVVLTAVLLLLQSVGVALADINPAVLNAVAAACTYVLSIGIVVWLPWQLQKRRTTKDELGLGRLPSWMDIGLAPAGMIIYFLASGILTYTVLQLVPGFNPAEPQQVGFNNLSHQYEYLLAFATLVIIAPVAEEILFRGYLYGKLRKAVPVWAAILAASVLFGLLHLQISFEDGVAVSGWNVLVDVFVLSVVMCSLREITGSIWAGILLHMLKNGVAFYFLFINPVLLNTIGG